MNVMPTSMALGVDQAVSLASEALRRSWQRLNCRLSCWNLLLSLSDDDVWMCKVVEKTEWDLRKTLHSVTVDEGIVYLHF